MYLKWNKNLQKWDTLNRINFSYTSFGGFSEGFNYTNGNWNPSSKVVDSIVNGKEYMMKYYMDEKSNTYKLINQYWFYRNSKGKITKSHELRKDNQGRL